MSGVVKVEARKAALRAGSAHSDLLGKVIGAPSAL